MSAPGRPLDPTPGEDSPSPPPAADVPTVPGFALDREIGRGAHGAVFLAREVAGLQRLVALKVFEPRDHEAYARELEVVRIIEGVRGHEGARGLVQALATGGHEGRSWIALEYLEQGSLQDLVAREGALPWERALRLVRDAAQAASVLHQHGVFHRDIKPGNLLLTQGDRALLGDFGLSRSLDGSLSAAGSVGFAAPEVLADKVTDGRRVDVYSLGATLAWLVTGERMRPGHPDLFALQRAGVPRAIQRLIVDAMALDVERRLPCPEAFLAAARELEPTPNEPGPVPVAAGARRSMAVGVLCVLLALFVVLADQASPPRVDGWEAAAVVTTESLLGAQALAGDATRAAQGWLGTVVGLDPTTPESATRLAQGLLSAHDLDGRVVSARAEGHGELLRRAGLTLLASVGPDDPGSAPRVALAHRCFALCRLLQPDRPLPEAVAALRRLGDSNQRAVQVAARPYKALWPQNNVLPPEVAERALRTRLPASQVEPGPPGTPPHTKPYPVPWGTLLGSFQRVTHSWRRSYRQGLRYRVLLGWLIERPDLEFLWFWAALEASGLERTQDLLALAQVGVDRAESPGVLMGYTQELFRAGTLDPALAACDRGIELSQQLQVDWMWLGIARGECLVGLGRLAEARRQIDALVDDPRAQREGAYWHLRARVLEAQGEAQAASTARSREQALQAALLEAEVRRSGWQLGE